VSSEAVYVSEGIGYFTAAGKKQSFGRYGRAGLGQPSRGWWTLSRTGQYHFTTGSGGSQTLDCSTTTSSRNFEPFMRMRIVNTKYEGYIDVDHVL
jgi:hypothetical protein